MSEPRLSRRGLVALTPLLPLAACGVAPGGGSSSPAKPPATSTAGPFGEDLLRSRFGVVDIFHPVEIVCPDFVLQRADLSGGRVAKSFEPGTYTAPFVGIEIDVREDGAGATVSLGTLAGDAGFSATIQDGTATIRVPGAGAQHPTVASAPAALRAGDTFGVALCENQVTVLLRRGGTWRAVLTARDAIREHGDLRRSDVLARLGLSWGGSGLGEGRAGVFGMVGLRDPHLVQNADGTPYTRDGHVYLTWTCAGLGFFQQAHWAVFRMDPQNPKSMVLVSHLFAQRDGRVLGDHAGQIVRDGDRWLVANSSWGDFSGAGVAVRAITTAADLLRGVHVLDTTPVALPTTVSSWDPAFTRVDGAWRMAFVESPSQSPFDFHPAMARTRAGSPFEGLERVGADVSRHQAEGMILARDRSGWKLLASDGVARRYLAYDLELNLRGTLNAPYGSNIPHAQVIALPDGRWLMVTFDDTTYFRDIEGYGGHGSVIVMRS